MSARTLCFSRDSTACAETRAVVQQPFQLRELAGDEAAEAGGDVDVTAGEFESHTVS